MYPADAGLTEFPASVFVNGQSLSLTSGGGSYAYGNTTNGVILEGSRWAVYVDGVRTAQRCLISNPPADLWPPSGGSLLVQDEFEDSYNVDYNDHRGTGTFTVVRGELCYYFNPSLQLGELAYDRRPSGGLMWTVYYPFGGWAINDDQSGPEGFYTNPFFGWTFNVYK